VQDDAPSAAERRVSTAGRDTTSAAASAAPRWTDGPTLDISAPATLPAPHPLAVRNRVIEQRVGRIVVRDRPAGRPEVVRDVGPGVALAATRGGHFILAVAPRTERRPHESPERAIVYRVP
jgi:hypothetical protein